MDAKKAAKSRANAREAFERAKSATAARVKFDAAMSKANAIADAMIQRGWLRQ